MAQKQRRRARAQRQRTRAQRQRQRQRQRTRRQKTRQEMRTRRAEGRQAVRTERIKQKGASGFYTPQGIKARGDVATGLIGQGIEIAGMVTTGGASSLLPSGDRRDMASEFIETFTQQEPQTEPSFFGGGGGGSLEPMQEDKPFYQNPLVIGGALIGGFFLYRSFAKR